MKTILTSAVLLVTAVVLLGAHESVRVEKPTVAGSWYPLEPDKLKACVDGLLDKARKPAPPGHCVACVLPHAPYETFGAVAAEAVKVLPPDAYDRVIILAPSHFSSFRGCSIPSVEAMLTPLGPVVVDCPAVRILDRSTLIEVRSLVYQKNMERRQLHEREYTTEVVLPWLQERLSGHFQIIPILVGDFEDYGKKTDENALAAVAEAIRPMLTPRTLLVTSSDLTHFGNKFSYRPFKENVLDGIKMLDQQAIDLLVARKYPEWQRYLEETENAICGKNALSLMLRLLPRQAKGYAMAHEISAERSGDLTTSISYASIVYMIPEAPAPAKTEEKP